MMGIFNVFVGKIADFKEYLTSMFENKVSPIADMKIRKQNWTCWWQNYSSSRREMKIKKEMI